MNLFDRNVTIELDNLDDVEGTLIGADGNGVVMRVTANDEVVMYPWRRVDSVSFGVISKFQPPEVTVDDKPALIL